MCDRAQVVGWPPIRSFRKKSVASASRNVMRKEDEEEEEGGKCVYVKVSMDGAPYLRKIDLKTYSSYAEVSSALEKMFSCFTCIAPAPAPAPEAGGGEDGQLLSHLMDSQYVLTYQDKDGDWMLVGDVPWE